jgi:hypothetical protein
MTETTTKRGGGTGAGRPNRDMVSVTFSVGRAVRERAEREAAEQGVNMADVFRHWVGIGQEQDDARRAGLVARFEESARAEGLDPADDPAYAPGEPVSYAPGGVRETSA